MSFHEFDRALRAGGPPAAELPALLRALWHDAQGDWEKAHALAQEDGTADGAWVHAYLHRREGDNGNAGYWYARAGRRPATTALDADWREIATEFLARHP